MIPQKLYIGILFIFLGIFYARAQNDIIISGLHTVAAGTTEEYNNITLNNNTSNLIVEGTLIVNGDLIMSDNNSQFSMGDNAFVLIYGNFIGANKVQISVSSYMIIQGDFIKNGSNNQGDLDISNGNLYIFGTVDGWPPEFTTCENYEGGSTGVNEEDCEFGTEDDFEKNYDDIEENVPTEFLQKLNCYNLSGPFDKSTCVGNSVTFSTNTLSGVNYHWQFRADANSEFQNTGTDSNQLTVNNITASMDGQQYRVIVKPVDPSESKCKVTISALATLTVTSQNTWTGSSDNDWNNNLNWSCGVLPDSTSDILIPDGLNNYPVLNSGATGQVRNITLAGAATVEVLSNSLEIHGIINSNAAIKAGTGTIIFNGNTLQEIPSGTFENNRIGNLVINNLMGVRSSGLLEISGILSLQTGVFETNDQLTLLSDISQTAIISVGSGIITGNVTMQRYLDSSFGYKYISSPFSNTSVNDFSGYVDLSSTFPHFYSYNEARDDGNGNDLSGWTPYTNSPDPLNVLEGYAINFGAGTTPLTVELSGSVNNGPYLTTLQNSNGQFTQGFNLVGNPYPSPIDWNASSGWTKQNIDDAIYFFNSSNEDQYSGTYTSYVAGISSTSGATPSIIPSMQGFFVKVSDGFTTGILGVSNEVRSNNLSQQFYKRNLDYLNRIYSRSIIRLNAGFKDIQVKDEAVIYFTTNAQPGFEKDKDALKLLNTDINVPSLYSLAPENKILSINGTSFNNESIITRIPLGLKTERKGLVSINLEGLENFQSHFIYLIDRQRRTGQNLKENKTLEIFLEQGTYNSRFELILSDTALSDPAVVFQDPFNVSKDNEEVFVRYNLKAGQHGLIQVFNINGQMLSSREVLGEGQYSETVIKNSGLYFFTLNTSKDRYTKKVMIKL